MKTSTKNKLLAASILLTTNSAALATTIIDQPHSPINPPPPSAESTSYFSDISSASEPSQLSDNFRVTTEIQTLDVKWYGWYNDVPGNPDFDATDYFTLRIFEAPESNNWVALQDPLGFADYSPGDLTIDRQDTGEKAFDVAPVYEYSTSFTLSQALATGDYALSIFNDTMDDPDNLWIWWGSNTSGAQGGANAQTRDSDLDAWRLVNTLGTPPGDNLAFTINSVPEPNNAALLLAAVGLLGFSSRKHCCS